MEKQYTHPPGSIDPKELLVVIPLLLTACATVVNPESPDSAPEDEVAQYSDFHVQFFGDISTWTHLAFHCKNDEGAVIAAIAGFVVLRDGGPGEVHFGSSKMDICELPYFNVQGPSGLNEDPDVLGIQGEALFLQVTDAWGGPLYPRTYDGEPFMEGGGMFPFDPEEGWLYLPDLPQED